MKRASLLINPKQQNKVTRLAHQAHVSRAEIYRRAVEAYHPINAQEEAALEQLAKAVIQSCQESSRSLERMHQMIQSTIHYLRQNKGNQNVTQQ